MEHSADELVASFFRTKAAAYASPTTVKAWIDSGNQDFVLVDVRLRGAARTWQIPGSLEIPATQMGERLNELPKDKMIVLYCWDTWCSLATTAAVVLADHGYRVKETVRWRSCVASSTPARGTDRGIDRAALTTCAC
jgi:rhodanese-related sulfurtransferase